MALWFDLALFWVLLIATGVVLVSMRTAQARARLAPLLLVLAGVTLTIGVANTAMRGVF